MVLVFPLWFQEPLLRCTICSESYSLPYGVCHNLAVGPNLERSEAVVEGSQPGSRGWARRRHRVRSAEGCGGCDLLATAQPGQPPSQPERSVSAAVVDRANQSSLPR